MLWVRHSWRRVRKYIAVLQVSIASNLAYIAEVFFRALLLIVLVFILSQLLLHQFVWPLFGGMVGFTLLFVAIAVGLFELGVVRHVNPPERGDMRQSKKMARVWVKFWYLFSSRSGLSITDRPGRLA